MCCYPFILSLSPSSLPLPLSPSPPPLQEEYRAGCGDGTPEGEVEKLFPCRPGHSVFSPVTDLVPDSRFMAVQTVNRESVEAQPPREGTVASVCVSPSVQPCTTCQRRGWLRGPLSPSQTATVVAGSGGSRENTTPATSMPLSLASLHSALSLILSYSNREAPGGKLMGALGEKLRGALRGSLQLRYARL